MHWIGKYTIAAICFCCSISQSQSVYKNTGFRSFKDYLNDDELDFTISIQSKVNYIVEMESKKHLNYKLSVSVLRASCMETSKHISFTSITTELSNDTRDTNLSRWKCTESDLFARIYDSSTNCLKIFVPEWENVVTVLITAFLELDDNNSTCPRNFNECSGCERLGLEKNGNDPHKLNPTELLISKNSKRCISVKLKCNQRNNCPNCQENDMDENDCHNRDNNTTTTTTTPNILQIILIALFVIGLCCLMGLNIHYMYRFKIRLVLRRRRQSRNQVS